MRVKQAIRNLAWTLAAVVALLSGCVKTTESPGRNDGRMRIDFSAPVIAETAATPAAQANGGQYSTRAALTEKTTVRVVAFTGTNPAFSAEQAYFVDSDGKLKPCTVNDDGSFKAADMASELALYPGTYDFYAITPALPLGANKNAVTVRNGIDFASSVTQNISITADKTQTLTQLDRKCAKIALVVKRGDDNTLMTALSVAAGGVTLNNLPPAVTTTGLNTAIAQASGSTTVTIPQTAFKAVGASVTESAAITYLLPRLGTSRMSLTYNLTYTVSGSSETKDVSGSMGNIALESGKNYTFTLTMRQAGASLAVTDWIDGGTQDVVTGKEFDYSSRGNPWFFIATADAKNPDINAIDPNTMDWYKATGTAHTVYNPGGIYRACPDGWRIPNHEELMLMFVVKEAFPTQYLPVNTDYWSVTEYSDTYSWITRMTNGYTFCKTEPGVDKTTNLRVRCVRNYVLAGKKTPNVVISTDNKVIIDSRDMLAGAITTNPKARKTEATNTTGVLVDNDTDIASAKSNLTVSHYFEVAKKDCKETEVPWLTAVNDCNTWTEDGGNWRLPTEREAMLMYILSKNIEQQASSLSFTPLKDKSYWTASQSTNLTDHSWVANPYQGIISYYGTINGNRATNYYVRCVRDVVPPPPADPIYIGLFGGWDETAQEYTKQLQVDWGYANTDPTSVWGPDNEATGATYKEYGPTNITELKKKSADLSLYPAVKYCANKGNGWYLPSQKQLMAVWIAHEGIPAMFSLNSDSPYWTATEFSNGYTWYVSVNGGGTNGFAKTKTSRVRCVKDASVLSSGAQVTTDANNRAIIDNRSMPAGAITASKKPRNIAGGIATAQTNKTVSNYFEVMKDDYNIVETMSWAAAIENCEKYDSGDGDKTWRLPTQRELQLIWILQKPLIKKTGFTAFSTTTPSYYWSATENDSISSWSIESRNGTVTPAEGEKTRTYRVRCVRDLAPPAN